MNSPTRLESDSLGPRSIPADALYGAHASRSRENFARFAPFPLPLPIYHAMALLKKACALANRELGDLPPDLADAIAAACDDVLSGTHDADLVLPIYQAGSGTSANMALNEVIANLANRALGQPLGTRSPVHPNDHVNRGQSTNNVFPSAAKVAVVQAAAEALRPAAAALADAFAAKADEFAPVLKAARTHLQDAVPITLGQEFHAYAAALRRDLDRLDAILPRLCQLGIGGNAVGTGLNTRLAFRPAVLRHLQPLVPCAPAPFAIPDDPIAATQFLTDFADYSATLRAFALDLQVIANDLRLLASGPRTGIAEIALPAVEPGSSIMPGKVNPSICEAANMAAIQVQGLDHAVALACGATQLELNTHMPLIAADTLHATALLAAALSTLADKCVRGITANADTCARHLEQSAALPTLLNPVLGYDRVAALVRESLATQKTLRDLALERNLLSPAAFDALLAASTSPNR
ncbi:MAG: aspartate ammonia-lyase [Kiritimatiellae bacterium]|nr:aspartate ammonia-lyase [Kiritimatiellia bacterium]